MRFHFYRIGFLLRICGGDRNIALRIRFGNLRVFTNLLYVIYTHVLDRSGIVFKVLNIEVYHFYTQLFHIGDDVFGYLFSNALSVLHHFF